MQSEIKRWGNSAAIRLPARILAEVRLEVNSPVSMTVDGRRIIIEAREVPGENRLRLPFSETDLLQGLDRETAHADELATPSGAEIGD